MPSPFEWISLFVQVGILAVLLYIAWQMRQVNAKTGVSFFVGGRHHAHFLPFHHRPWPDIHHLPSPDIHHGSAGGIQFGIAYSIWTFRGGSWSLLKPCGQPGCTCGSSPTGAGQYEGQVIRRECPPR